MKTLFWAYFSRATNIGSSLVIMPFALSLLPTSEFNIWMIFVAFYGLLMVFDFGLTPTISRQYNYILAGADTIEKKGKGVQREDGQVNVNLLKTLNISSKIIFLSISIIAGCILILSYPFYLKDIASRSDLSIITSWSLYSSAIIVSIFSFHLNAIFVGTNHLNELYKTCSISNVVFFVFAISLLTSDWGVLGIAIARIISSLVYFAYATYSCSKIHEINLIKNIQDYSSTKEVILSLLPNTTRVGLVTIGNFVATKGLVLISANYLSPDESASFAFALNIYAICTSVSLVYMSIKTPTLNRLHQQGDFNNRNLIQNKIYLVCLGLVIIFTQIILFTGNFFLDIIDSNVKLPTTSILILFSLASITECIRNIAMNYISSGNKIPFTYPTLLTGLTIVISTQSLYMFGYNSMAVPLTLTLLAQSAFNNWYWVRYELKERYPTVV